MDIFRSDARKSFYDSCTAIAQPVGGVMDKKARSGVCRSELSTVVEIFRQPTENQSVTNRKAVDKRSIRS